MHKNDVYKLDANGFLPLAFPTSSAVTIPITFLFLRCPFCPNALPISTSSAERSQFRDFENRDDGLTERN